MDRQKVNAKYVDGVKELLKRHKGRFVIAIVLNDDETVDVMMNVHMISPKELTYSIGKFTEHYYEALKKMRDDTN